MASREFPSRLGCASTPAKPLGFHRRTDLLGFLTLARAAVEQHTRRSFRLAGLVSPARSALRRFAFRVIPARPATRFLTHPRPAFRVVSPGLASRLPARRRPALQVISTGPASARLLCIGSTFDFDCVRLDFVVARNRDTCNLACRAVNIPDVKIGPAARAQMRDAGNDPCLDRFWKDGCACDKCHAFQHGSPGWSSASRASPR